ncbi:hypothetical protein Acsp04_24900 [Actinomadura sp. NBRC 104425]|uniref:hypothetical protein n=1 Tax=Actinomadura sp. NBRC 104425 TaxID=3032204 RepID=UPI00249FE786|nr:hypothetical protein [Actinomadura sp. NBRC 104425]GLZ12255.1 hypothetical protein Acsp04_24900 [Actinomadura sp. NBRC 104425]
MTERRTGAPEPVEPSRRGDAPASGALTGDLSAVRRTDAVFEALARHAASFAPAAEPAASAFEPGAPRDESGTPGDAEAELDERLRAAGAESDPAVRLLRALVADVAEPGPGRRPGPEPPSGPRRRGRRTIVALGVAGAVLASGGVAAAGGDLSRRSAHDVPSGEQITRPADDPSADTKRQTLRAAPPATGSGANAGRARAVPRTSTSPAPSRKPAERRDRAADRSVRSPAPSASPSPSPTAPDDTLIQPARPGATPSAGLQWPAPPAENEFRRRIEEIRRWLTRPAGQSRRSGESRLLWQNALDQRTSEQDKDTGRTRNDPRRDRP